MMKKITVFLFLAVSLFFTSCKSSVSVKPSAVGADFDVSISFGSAFCGLFSAVFPSEKGGETRSFFDDAQIAQVLTATGIQNVRVKSNGQTSLQISGSAAASGNPLVDSGIIVFAPDGNVSLVFSSQNLQALYGLLPFELASYIDMLMAPAFTGEEMTDGEYIDSVATVYGKNVADELNDGEVKFNIHGTDDRTNSSSLSAVKLLNVTGTVRFCGKRAGEND